MGVATLHHHFRTMTTMSPLQYQKQPRLHEARQFMLTEALDACSAALEVGYESTTQFNREYSRPFGQPPRRNVEALRETVDRPTRSLAGGPGSRGRSGGRQSNHHATTRLDESGTQGGSKRCNHRHVAVETGHVFPNPDHRCNAACTRLANKSLGNLRTSWAARRTSLRWRRQGTMTDGWMHRIRRDHFRSVATADPFTVPSQGLRVGRDDGRRVRSGFATSFDLRV